ncbi:MAG TPA: hypothetical protein VG796_13460 [Verrucomicrobiales bacterium]|jgi:hypothetical protein|nr:hypothetical protein [Verrucomicrobiales bacterium]
MKWITRLTIVAVFVLGAVSGVMFGMRLEREKLLNMQRMGAASLTDRALEKISGEVKLTPQQKDRLREVLKGVQPAIAAAENERRNKVMAAMESVRTSAFGFLDATQQKRFESLHERMKNRLNPAAKEPATAAAIFGGW